MSPLLRKLESCLESRKKRPSLWGRALSYWIEPHSVAEESVMN